MRPYESSSVGQGSARRNALDPSAQSRAIAGRRHPQRTGGVDPNDRPGLAEGHPLDQPSGRVNRRARLEDVVANDLVFTVRWLVPDGLEAWKPVIVSWPRTSSKKVNMKAMSSSFAWSRSTPEGGRNVLDRRGLS
jgi:hypothetical protein